MLKSELMTVIAEKMNHLPVSTVEEGVRIILKCMSQAILHEQRIEIRGFGSFSVHKMPERTAHNPKTGIKLVKEAKNKVHFKPGLELKRRVSESWQTTPIVKD